VCIDTEGCTKLLFVACGKGEGGGGLLPGGWTNRQGGVGVSGVSTEGVLAQMHVCVCVCVGGGGCLVDTTSAAGTAGPITRVACCWRAAIGEETLCVQIFFRFVSFRFVSFRFVFVSRLA
jgi:hypothetical protein